MSAAQLEDIVKRLTIQETEPKSKYEAACTLRDSLDHYTNGPIYSHFLSRVMPLIINILRGPCIFQNTSLEQVSGPWGTRRIQS
ncbi:hypothetical protein ANO14919_019750 [Xylariales sp. No.14919]|nr:hypothetical protein ANO14919_019750 [Xylariales sp. No.14919]